MVQYKQRKGHQKKRIGSRPRNKVTQPKMPTRLNILTEDGLAYAGKVYRVFNNKIYALGRGADRSINGRCVVFSTPIPQLTNIKSNVVVN